LQGVASQQRQFTAHTQHGHDPQIGSDRRPRVAGLDGGQRSPGHIGAPRHLHRAQALRLAQALEPVAELQKQLALEDGGGIGQAHLPIILDKFIVFDQKFSHIA
jgi:hypothetical protein